MDALVLDVTCRAVSNSLILASTIRPPMQHADDRRRDDIYGEKGLDTLVVCKVSAHDEILSLMLLLIVDVMIIEVEVESSRLRLGEM